MERNYKIGARTSPLALKQIDEILGMLKKFYPHMDFKVMGIKTLGDRDKVTPISQVEGSDFFTREIDRTLLNRDINGERSRTIDFAIHSAKDLPDNLFPGLSVAAVTKSIDPFDVLVARDNLPLSELKVGAKIGTSSLRRKQQLKNYREDFRIVDIRGNIEERLKLVDNSTELDGIVIAAAGLLRLGLGYRITQRIPLAILKPHPLQGALAVVTRSEDLDLINILSVLDTREVAGV